MAIPATILYKSFMGEAPFPTVTSTTNANVGGKARISRTYLKADAEPLKKDAAMCWSMIFTIMYGTTDSILGESTFISMRSPTKFLSTDFYGIVSEWVDPNRGFDPVMKFFTLVLNSLSSPGPTTITDFLRYTNMMSSWLVMGVGTYSKPTNDVSPIFLNSESILIITTREQNLRGMQLYANLNTFIPTYSKLIYLLKQVIGTSCTTMVVIFDSANRKFGLTIPGDKLMDIMGTLIPTVYGLTSFASGIWHIVNIAKGTETGVSCSLGLESLSGDQNAPI